MLIYCDSCDFKRDYGEDLPPRRCPKCNGLDLWFEKDERWNAVCQLWATWKGWQGQLNEDVRQNRSIPEWYYREHKLCEWEEFKNRMTDPSAIGPPPSVHGEKIVETREKAVDFWLDETGVIKMWISGAESLDIGIRAERDVAKQLCWNSRSLNIIRQLGEAYLNYWGLGQGVIEEKDIPKTMS